MVDRPDRRCERSEIASSPRAAQETEAGGSSTRARTLARRRGDEGVSSRADPPAAGTELAMTAMLD
jgi:hypothetical protein